MTPLKQTIFHDPPRTYGNCHQAALASVLNLSLDVPHFMDGLEPKDGEIFNPCLSGCRTQELDVDGPA